ncbi:hypothetical protein Scep_019410 [Stephania cephalantha]|uniref:Uncharacterized protein n=1 Tax=Stephania cephalantha TaxID=152367 RepID=A0AAP0IAM0_9MAGN
MAVTREKKIREGVSRSRLGLGSSKAFGVEDSIEGYVETRTFSFLLLNIF